MARTFLLAAAHRPQAAARAVAASELPPDLIVTSPSTAARETAALAVHGRWVFTVAEPLLAERAPGESGGDVLARLARALRGLRAYKSRALLVVFDRLDILGADVFVLNEEGLMRWADDLERAVPLP